MAVTRVGSSYPSFKDIVSSNPKVYEESKNISEKSIAVKSTYGSLGRSRTSIETYKRKQSEVLSLELSRRSRGLKFLQ